jgi:dephospho-CoA kinase
MIKVGCTGGIAAGKSLLCSYLGELGASVIDADVVTHRLLATNLDLKNSLISHFGTDILDHDGTISRLRLGEKAFSSLGSGRMLNEITHPYIRKEISFQIDVLERQNVPPKVVVLEGALLVETGAVDFYGLRHLIVVEAPDDVVSYRLRLLRGMAQDTIDQRIAAQMEKLRRIRQGDYVVINSGSEKMLYKMAVNVYSDITNRLGSTQAVTDT